MACLYPNENFPLPIVLHLRDLGHDVLTIQETGKAGQSMPDENVLEFANQQQRVLLTLNRKHFIRLHKQRYAHAGIVACTLDPDFQGCAKRIDEAIQREGDLSQKIIRVNRPQK